MVTKALKYGSIVVAGGVLVGLVVFGTDVFSYARASLSQLQSSAKDAVPLELELARSRDLLAEIMPELQANIRLIAKEEVEMAELKADIARSFDSLEDEQTRIGRIRQHLDTRKVAFVIGGRQFDRQEMTAELSRAFDRFQEAEMVVRGKQRLLNARHAALEKASAALERARSRKLKLEDDVAGLESKHRLVVAATQTSQLSISDSALARSERLIRDIRKRLDVAERVLARNAEFAEQITFEEPVDEQELLARVDAHFDPGLAHAGANAADPMGMGDEQ